MQTNGCQVIRLVTIAVCLAGLLFLTGPVWSENMSRASDFEKLIPAGVGAVVA
jgi:hypothetical protein